MSKGRTGIGDEPADDSIVVLAAAHLVPEKEVGVRKREGSRAEGGASHL